jgi:hypothetical protein
MRGAERVGTREVELQAPAHALAEEVEAARHQQRLQAGALARLHEHLDAGVELQPLVVHALQRAFGHAGQHRHAAAQAVFVVCDLAAHRGLGDRRDLGPAACDAGDLVDALDVDQRRVHVERDQLVVGQLQRRRDAAREQAGCDFGR